MSAPLAVASATPWSAASIKQHCGRSRSCSSGTTGDDCLGDNSIVALWDR
jgi:hypothetical protein